MPWTAADIPSLVGRVAVVTGANGGLGLETARELARAGAHVVMAVRNLEKAEAARSSILGDMSDARLELVALDLGDQDSVKKAAAAIAEAHPRVDILVNNAGLMAMPERTTKDGYEMQLGVNHLGHWTFTAGLLRPILRGDGSRVVTVTSTAHHMGRALDPDNPHLRGSYGPWKAYGNSKLANFHFALGLQRHFEAAGVSAQSMAAHPGLTNSELQATAVAEGGGGRMAHFWQRVAAGTGMSTEDGALPQLRAATDPEANGGEFYGPRYVNRGHPVRLPVMRRIGLEKAIANLWRISERETGVPLDVISAAADL